MTSVHEPSAELERTPDVSRSALPLSLFHVANELLWKIHLSRAPRGVATRVLSGPVLTRPVSGAFESGPRSRQVDVLAGVVPCVDLQRISLNAGSCPLWLFVAQTHPISDASVGRHGHKRWDTMQRDSLRLCALVITLTSFSVIRFLTTRDLCRWVHLLSCWYDPSCRATYTRLGPSTRTVNACEDRALVRLVDAGNIADRKSVV